MRYNVKLTGNHPRGYSPASIDAQFQTIVPPDIIEHTVDEMARTWRIILVGRSLMKLERCGEITPGTKLTFSSGINRNFARAPLHNVLAGLISLSDEVGQQIIHPVDAEGLMYRNLGGLTANWSRGLPLPRIRHDLYAAPIDDRLESRLEEYASLNALVSLAI